jgi:hypothetical protein
MPAGLKFGSKKPLLPLVTWAYRFHHSIFKVAGRPPEPMPSRFVTTARGSSSNCRPRSNPGSFSLDRHSGHLALNKASVDLFHQNNGKTRLLEYFVYYQWRMLSQGDIHKYIRGQSVDSGGCVGRICTKTSRIGYL